MADFLVALAEFDRDRRWAELGYPNLWAFLHRHLGLSAGAAHYRKTAAVLLQRFPEVIEPLQDGRLCFTTVCEVARVLTAENRADVLPRFFNRSHSQAAELAVELRPRPVPLRTVVRAVPPTSFHMGETDPGRVQAPGVSLVAASPSTPPAEAPAPAPPPAAPSRATATPLTAEASRLSVTVSREFLEKLERARMALSHSHPGAGVGAVLEVGLDLVLARQAKRRALTEEPRKARQAAGATIVEAAASPFGESAPPVTPGPAEPPAPKPRSRWIPAAIRREAWRRDGGRCQWNLVGGGVCGSTLRVEIHHVRPWSIGGPAAEASELECLCQAHHRMATEEVFGMPEARRRLAVAPAE